MAKKLNETDREKQQAVFERFSLYRAMNDYLELKPNAGPEDWKELEHLKAELLALTGKLGFCKERNIIENKFIFDKSRRVICREMLISEETYIKLYRRGMLRLYEIITEENTQRRDGDDL